MKNPKKSVLRVVGIFAAFMIIGVIALTVVNVFSSFIGDNNDNSSSISQPQTDQTSTDSKVPVDNAEVKAMWISYLEYQNMEMSNKSGFVKDITTMFQNCKNMGLNTVIVHVRPFGDALYKSDIFPYSHFLTGTQGIDPGYDPLAEMIEIAHGMGLRLEAWINPYRVQSGSKNPSELATFNPAQNSELTIAVDGGVYYNPALEQVHQLVVDGVLEIVKNYNVDGIHFDDYFYPTTDRNIDKEHYQAYTGDLSQDDWRRDNVNTLIKKVYQAIKNVNQNITFGISPQGNNDNNYNSQYSDVSLWLSKEGYVDYIMPQLYWGFDYLTASGNERYKFKNLIEEWANYPRSDKVKLYIGLGAYRIGVGDGGSNPQDEWSSGDNLAKMVSFMKTNKNVTGWAIYRYDNLFKAGEYQNLANSEVAALTAENNK